MDAIAAGQHTIVYTLKSGYTGTATLSVSGDNATVSGMNFTLSGTPEGDEDISVVLSLYGSIPAENGGTVIVNGDNDDGMSITDILLIVLVVLIVIMAILVAIRMMRS